jgi:hypothetical protein
MRTLLAMLAASTAAAAQDRPDFGHAGQVLPLGSIAIQRISSSASNSNTATLVQLAPGLLVFAADNVLLGGDLVYQSISQGSTSLSSWGVDLNAGGGFNIAPRVSVLLIGSVGYLSQSASGLSSSRTSVLLGGSLPLLVHVAPHFFVGIGPQLATEISATVSNFSGDVPKATTFAIKSIIGGWF